MKTQAQIQAINSKFKELTKIDLDQVQQGSEMWLKVRLGVLTASNASKIVAKKDSDTRFTYMSQLISEVCIGDIEEINAKALEWGRTYEPAARSSYEFETGSKIIQTPFIFKDDSFREGASPDGLLSDRALELKCPWSGVNYIKFLTDDYLKPEWKYQIQFQMRVIGCDIIDMCQYHPQMKKHQLKIRTIEKDEKMQATLSDAVPQFISDMDETLKKIGVKFGSQWTN